MTKEQLILDSPVRSRKAKPFFEIFADLVSQSSRASIVVGYASVESLQHLQNVCETFRDFNLDLTLGMHAREGMSTRQKNEALALNDRLRATGRGGVYVVPRMAYHGKIYFFEGKDFSKAYIGSANLSSIVPQYQKSLEAGILLDSPPAEIAQHIDEDVIPFREDIATADIPTIEADTSPMVTVDEADPISKPDVVAIFSSPVTYKFELPLKANEASSLNAHRGGDGKRSNNYGGLMRDWFEGELIVGKKISTQPGYPKAGEEFRVVTDDCWEFRCKTSGAYGKNLRSANKLSTFGTWLKSRLIAEDAIKFGDTATQETIEKFGYTHLVMEFRPDHDTWTFRFDNA